MTTYITQGRYSQQAITGMLDKPEDRREAVAALMKASGFKLIEFYVTLGDYDFMAITEGPDKLNPGLLVAAASGAVSDLKTTVAYSSAEMKTAAEKAAKIREGYRPPGS